MANTSQNGSAVRDVGGLGLGGLTDGCFAAPAPDTTCIEPVGSVLGDVLKDEPQGTMGTENFVGRTSGCLPNVLLELRKREDGRNSQNCGDVCFVFKANEHRLCAPNTASQGQ